MNFKKLKYIPVLLSVAILAACDATKIVVKAPTFASKGKSIEQADFKTEIINAYNENEYFQEDLNLTSREVVIKETTVERQKRARNKKIYYSDENTTLTEAFMRYDAQNLLLEDITTVKNNRVIEGDEINSKKSSKTSNDLFFEVGSSEYANIMLTLDLKNKEMELGDAVADNAAAKKVLDQNVARQFSFAFNSSRMMHYAEATDVQFYKFYKKNNLFTVIYKEKYETSESTTINDHSVDVKKYYITRETQSQVDLAEGAEAIRISDKTDTTCEILVDHSGYQKGEIIDVQSIKYTVFTSLNKNVNLERINDYSSYLLKN